jgi:hypothetical protein
MPSTPTTHVAWTAVPLLSVQAGTTLHIDQCLSVAWRRALLLSQAYLYATDCVSMRGRSKSVSLKTPVVCDCM